MLSLKPKVIATGCFDVVHIGHIRLLKFASSLGHLTVGINSDRSIKKLKGETRPINDQISREEFLRSISFVEDVVVIDDVNVASFIRDQRADFWVKGSDYTIESLNFEEKTAAKDSGTSIVFAPFTDGKSSSWIIEKLK